MPALSITKTYADGDILTEADLDNIRSSIETWANSTKLDDDNIQDGGISAIKLGIDDNEFIELGTGNDGQIGVVSDNLQIKNVTLDKDISFSVDDGGVTKTPLTIKGADGKAQLGENMDANSKKIENLAAATASGDAVSLALLKQFMPTGIIQAYGANTAPTGWLICDGSTVSRTTYADLFAVIGITAGQGDGSTTFHLPDLRGRFLRGKDSGAGNDPNAASRTALNTGGNTADNVFSLQADGVGPHVHTINATNGGTNPANTAALTGLDSDDSDNVIKSTGPTIIGETRPKNVNVVYIIKT